MKLTLWTYEGPPHVGAMRIASSMEGLHYVLHAPQGDTYADLLFTMIQRDAKRPPVTYTTFQARDLGSDTADLFRRAVEDTVARHKPEALIVGASCTAELIQDDPGGLAEGMGLDLPVVPLELPAYQKKENWGAAETLYQLVRRFAKAGHEGPAERTWEGKRVNILGPTALGFRNRDDLVEVRRILDMMGIDVNVVAPVGARPGDLMRLAEADANVMLYPEISESAARWLKKAYNQPHTTVQPIGVGATRDFIAELAAMLTVDPGPALELGTNLPWYARSVDSTYLTGKRVFIFADGTHALAAARVAREEFGFEIAGLGTYSREMARPVRGAAEALGIEALITDDYLVVEAAIAEAAPELVLGTQMERHIAKRLGIGCAVISSPVHVQDFPARYAPQMGFEGANVLWDTWVHPLVMGLEEHLLAMFREDFEFNDAAQPSHLGHGARSVEPDAITGAPLAEPLALDTLERAPPERVAEVLADTLAAEETATAPEPLWHETAERELRKVPFFVRGKARRNTEAYARERGVAEITVDVLYEAKAHHAR
ncbi:MAG: ferredoxin:protochlorophyllide reductase (ATP-dependent) subunit B [Pseudomonadota bacterium]